MVLLLVWRNKLRRRCGDDRTTWTRLYREDETQKGDYIADKQFAFVDDIFSRLEN